MASVVSAPPVCVWQVEVHPPVEADAGWRERLLARIQPMLLGQLERRPDRRDFAFGSTLLEIRVRHVSGAWGPGASLQLRYRDPLPSGRPARDQAEALRRIAVPDPAIAARATFAVGLGPLVAQVLVRLRCAWDGGLDAWSAGTGGCVPAPVRLALEAQVPLFVFHGDPGTGKSLAAQLCADRYCREARAAGRLFWLSTNARGQGLVGDFSQRLRSAFEVAAGAADGGPTFLLIDEAEAVAMARSNRQSHQEDVAATGTLLQCLDEVGGQRVAVFLTTNLPQRIDAAVRRRGVLYPFARPADRARRQLLDRWIPGADERFLNRAAAAADGMTPADIERALGQAYLAAVAGQSPVREEQFLQCLRRGERTGRV